MISIGIDNGLFGAVVAIDSSYKILFYFDTPIVNLTKTKKGGKKSIGHEFAPATMCETLKGFVAQYPTDRKKIWLEVAQAMPQQGLSSTFKTGRGAGLWEGIVVGLGLSYDVVHAKTWTKALLKDVPAGDPKERSMIKAQRLFGADLPLTKPGGRVLSLDGRADAALIACYGMAQSRGDWDDIVKVMKKTPVLKKH